MRQKPANIHGRSLRTTNDAGTGRIERPRSLKSMSTVKPTNKARDQTWVDSTRGYTQRDSWSSTLHRVSESHWQNGRSDIRLHSISLSERPASVLISLAVS